MTIFEFVSIARKTAGKKTIIGISNRNITQSRKTYDHCQTKTSLRPIFL